MKTCPKPRQDIRQNEAENAVRLACKDLYGYRPETRTVYRDIREEECEPCGEATYSVTMVPESKDAMQLTRFARRTQLVIAFHQGFSFAMRHEGRYYFYRTEAAMKRARTKMGLAEEEGGPYGLLNYWNDNLHWFC